MNWVVNGKPEWMLYEFPPLNHYRCFPVLVQMFAKKIYNVVLCDVMCEQKFFTYNYFHSIFPVVFVSRTNLFLFTTFRSRQTYTPDTDRDQNWRTEPILVASRTQNISQNLLKYLATYLTFWISFFRNYQSFL